MNYEELLRLKANGVERGTRIPVGLFYRAHIDGKYVNRVDVRKSLLDSIGFCEGMKRECEENLKLTNGGQIHFRAELYNGEPVALEVEQGNYKSFRRLLCDTPAVVARPAFVSAVVTDLLRLMDDLHSNGIFHVCFSPDNVFVRSGDNRIMLLSHGSFYLNTVSPKELYENMDDYVAPEVMGCGTVDERCDIYSAGKFLEYLFSVSDMPYEYKKVVAKAVEIVPEDRFQSVRDMAEALKFRAALRRGVRTFAVAAAFALLIVGGYFGLMPSDTPVEFVEPVAVHAQEDLSDNGFNPETELGAAPDDTVSMLSADQQRQMKEYEDKCEQIFRKMYTKEADRILSKIYNSDYMGSNEKKFVAGSRNTMTELVEAQVKLAEKAHLSEARSQRIASEIIERLTEDKKKTLGSYGIQK